LEYTTAIWYSLRPFGNLVAIWYISSRFGILNKKNLATLCCILHTANYYVTSQATLRGSWAKLPKPHFYIFSSNWKTICSELEDRNVFL
jgi:hypothetical protein